MYIMEYKQTTKMHTKIGLQVSVLD